MSFSAHKYLEAMRAESIPAGSAGLWVIRKSDLKVWLPHKRFLDRTDLPDTKRCAMPQITTHLMRYTNATLMTGGECVMEDTVVELRRHLEFIRIARGRVLVTGLGLGCVLRGLLLNPNVTHVDVIERAADVLKMVRGHLPDGRFDVVHAEAGKWLKENPTLTWDCAWHDCWSDPDKEEPHLQVIHNRFILDLLKRVPVQGAWDFPRDVRRAMRSLPPIKMPPNFQIV